ncbi:MAG: hypothetical protein C0467_00585 [Planctomycetaceae bacterium]|nr:hypothetical protein [Planctomycetaceae bacterium]
MRRLLALAVIGLVAGEGAAQYPTYGGTGGYPPINPANVMPNIYNPSTQPLSPYLNLLRGGNQGVNYFYGVRPGTVGAGIARSGGAPFVAGGGNRTAFFPQLASAPDPLAGIDADPGDVLPSAGHGVVFGNTMGYFPGPNGQAGGARGGLAGIGAARPAPKK